VTKRSDIREHYCPNIVAVDTAERDHALRMMRDEQKKRERMEKEATAALLRSQLLEATNER
jgi:hypothetical protein